MSHYPSLQGLIDEYIHLNRCVNHRYRMCSVQCPHPRPNCCFHKKKKKNRDYAKQCQAMRNAKQCAMPSNAKLRVESKPQIISVKELPGRSICGDHLRTLPSVACPVETCGNHWETLEAHGSAMNRCSSVSSVSCLSWNRSSLGASPDWGTHVSWYLQGEQIEQPGANSDHAKSHEELC